MKQLKTWILACAVVLGIASVAQLGNATLTNTNTKTIAAIGNGVTTNYTIGFVFEDNDEIRVYRRDESSSPATITEITQGVGASKFTITGGDPGTTVVMGTAPSSTQRIVIQRVTPKTQGVQYSETEAFPASDHEQQMDRMVQMIQEVGASTATKIGYADGTSQTSPPTFPEPSASGIVGWNSAGTNLENKTPSSIVSGGDGLQAANNLSDVDSATTAVSNLGLPAAANIYSAGGTDVAIADGGTGASSATAGFNALDPLTTKGDLVCHDGTNSTKIGVGANGEILTANSTEACGVEWAPNSASVTGTANYVAIYSGLGALSEEAQLAKTRGGFGADMSGATFPATGTYTTDAGVSNLSNKGIDADANTITNIENADIKSGAAIARDKLASGTASHVVINNGSGVMSSEAQLAGSRGGTGADISGLTGAAYANAGVVGIETALNQSRGGTGFSTYTTGDMIYASATDTLSKLAKGSAGQVLKMNAGATAPEWGAAGGAGGINFVPLDSSWAFTAPDNMNGDLTVGGWTAYADAAATSPVDMTGGSPNTTCVRNSTGASVLNGTGSLEMVLSSAGSRQGEGCSLLTYVPTAYRGQTVTFTFPFKLAGVNVEDDIRVFAYDVTNSELITPYTSSKIVGTSGQLQASFATKTTTAQMRVGLHVARTSTGQLSVLFDDVSVGPQAIARGLAGGNWTDESGLFTWSAGVGTPSENVVFTRRVGDDLQVRGYVQFGTATATNVSLDFPSKYNFDTTKLTSNSQVNRLGSWDRVQDSLTTDAEAVFYDGSDTNSVYFAIANSSDRYAKSPGTSLGASGDRMAFNFSVPISGWDANVSMAESSQFKISSYLANGTRVTATPTALGQYRSYLRTAGSQTLTETNGTPTFTPTAADGFRIYNGNAYTSADTNNEPTGYDIFIGKNKSWRFECYASPARTGFIDTGTIQGGSDYGYTKNYDPSTGIFSIRGFRFNGGGVGHVSGFDSVNGNANDPYCDIIVSENAVAVGMQVPRSYVNVHTHNGEGSSSTNVVKFSTVLENVGSAITYANSATLGDSWTINEPGIYTMDVYCEANHGSSDNLAIGWTKNSSGLTTSIEAITTAERMCYSGMNGTYGDSTAFACSKTKVLAPGDILRVQSNAADPTNAARCGAGVTKVGN